MSSYDQTVYCEHCVRRVDRFSEHDCPYAPDPYESDTQPTPTSPPDNNELSTHELIGINSSPFSPLTSSRWVAVCYCGVVISGAVEKEVRRLINYHIETVQDPRTPLPPL